MPRVKKAINYILIVALLHQSVRIFDNSFVPLRIHYNDLVDAAAYDIHITDTTSMACKNEISDWVQALDVGVFYMSYYTFRILFVFLFPCTALIYLNIMLFRALKRAEHNRTELMRHKFSCTSQQQQPLSDGQATPQQTDFTLQHVVSRDARGHIRVATAAAAASSQEASLAASSELPPTSTAAAAAHKPRAPSAVSLDAATQTGSRETVAATIVPMASVVAATSPAAASHTVTQSARHMDSYKTTLMLVVVVTVFLLVEVPVALVTIAHVVINAFDIFKEVEVGVVLNYIKLFTNFLIIISYPFNFTIYCSMSQKFRETFKDLLACKRQCWSKSASMRANANNNNILSSRNGSYRNNDNKNTSAAHKLLKQQQQEQKTQLAATTRPLLEDCVREPRRAMSIGVTLADSETSEVRQALPQLKMPLAQWPAPVDQHSRAQHDLETCIDDNRS